MTPEQQGQFKAQPHKIMKLPAEGAGLIFLLQFVANMRLTPEQLAMQKQRLVALSNDELAHPALRRSARDVAACWNGTRTGQCRPSDKDSSEQLDTR
jgi:hypothetical protein